MVYMLEFHSSDIIIYSTNIMATPKRLTPSGITTNLPSDQLYRSKNFGMGSGLGGANIPIP